jgi:hypothetical protein
MNAGHNGHWRLWISPIQFPKSTGPTEMHISIASSALYDQVLFPGTMQGVWMLNVPQAGWNSDGSMCLLTSQSCCIHKHFIRNMHSCTYSVDIHNNATMAILRLLSGDGKINFYEPSFSVNTAWHFKRWHISILWKSLPKGTHWNYTTKRMHWSAFVCH